MKHIWLIIILFLNNLVIAQINGNDSFSHLNILSISTTDTTLNSYIKFDNQNSEILNVKFNNMPDFLMDYCGSDNLKLIRTKLKNNENKYYVVTYGSFDGWMQGFTIYEEKEPNRIIGQIKANSIIIPGNGNIYTINRCYENFVARKKYSIVDNKLKEVKQPFYSVNLTSHALKPISIYSDVTLTNKLAVIPVEGKIEVILSTDTDSQSDIYLVRTSFGLIGWTKLVVGQYKSVDVEGLYYWGD